MQDTGAYGIERNSLSAPRIVGGIKDLCAVIIHIDNITIPHNATLQTRMKVLFGHPVKSYEQV